MQPIRAAVRLASSVGIPGLVLALWVLTLREPVRGAIDGLPTPEDPEPFRGFVRELFQVIPPFTEMTWRVIYSASGENR